MPHERRQVRVAAGALERDQRTLAQLGAAGERVQRQAGSDTGGPDVASDGLERGVVHRSLDCTRTVVPMTAVPAARPGQLARVRRRRLPRRTGRPGRPRAARGRRSPRRPASSSSCCCGRSSGRASIRARSRGAPRRASRRRRRSPLLYRTLAIGPMSVLSPVTALVSAALPVGVGLHQRRAASAGSPSAAWRSHSSPSSWSAAAPTRVANARAGTALAARLRRRRGDRAAARLPRPGTGRQRRRSADRRPRRLLRRRPRRRLRAARAASATRRPSLPASAAAGALDSLANFAFLLAVRDGDLAVVAVITALYPAGTVLLARALLGRAHRRDPARRTRARRRGGQPARPRMTETAVRAQPSVSAARRSGILSNQ